jgi:hypothetical protein
MPSGNRSIGGLLTLGPSAYPSRRIGAYQNQEVPDLIIDMTH